MPAHIPSALQNLLSLTYRAELGREETYSVLLVLDDSVYIGVSGQKNKLIAGFVCLYVCDGLLLP